MNTKSNKKNTKRKNERGARGGFAPVTQVTDKRTVVFRYPSGPLLTESTSGIGAVYSYRANALFDPDFTGGGLQPIGFDQFSALYGRYTVIHAKFEVVFANTTSLPIRAGYYLSPQSTLPSSPATWSMQPYGKSVTLGAVGSGKDVVTLRGSTSLYKELGITRNQFLNEADFSANTSANPSRVLYVHTYIHGLTGAGNATASAFMRLYQTAELSQLVNLTYS